MSLEDSSHAELWKHILLSQYPAEPPAVQMRVLDIRQKYSLNAAAQRHHLEKLWDQVGPVEPSLLAAGFDAAERAGDPDEIRVWANRWTRSDSSAELQVGTALVAHPETRTEGFNRLRAYASRLDGTRHAERELFHSVSEQRSQNREESQIARTLLGLALVASGDTSNGLSALRDAAADIWDVGLLRTVGDAHIAAGDTVAALAAWSRVAADPGTPETFGDTVRHRTGRAGTGTLWSAAVARQRSELRVRTLQKGVAKALPRDLALLTSDGSPASLDQLLAERNTIVMFWSRGCIPSVDALDRLQHLHATGVNVLAITDEGPTKSLVNWLQQRGIRLPVLHDPRHLASHSFGAVGTPGFFVVDATRRIRFEHSSEVELLRQLDAIRTEPR
jgi:peroxiredoxin